MGSLRKVSFAGNTNMGRVRTNNEDAFVVQNVWDENHVLAVAIDGVGGYEGGEVAAAIAKKSIVEYLLGNSNGEKADLLKRAVIYANNNICGERHRDAKRSHMSCVLTAVLVDVEEQYVIMAHVGDTRLYQYCDGEIVKLSHDHSLVGYREEIGDLTEEEAMHHPQRNVISRDVGSRMLAESDDEYVEVNSFPLLPNSSLLLCSDGLCDMITSSAMAMVLAKDIPVAAKVKELIADANRAGGKDNVTVVVVEYCADDDGVLVVPEELEVVNVGEEESHSAESGMPVTDRHSVFTMKRVLLLLAVLFVVAALAFVVGKYSDRIFGDDKPQIEETCVPGDSLPAVPTGKEVVGKDAVSDEAGEKEQQEVDSAFVPDGHPGVQ